MVDARSLWQFDPPLARVLYEFLFQPSTGAHAERLFALWPEGSDPASLKPQGDAALSRALMRVLALDEQVPLDVDRPMHRCALMPIEGLARVGRAVEVYCLAPRLRRVILRSELQALDSRMGPDDWAMALAQPDHAHWGLHEANLQDMPIDEVMALFDHLGWAVLEQAFGQLPPSVGRRASLKLPVRPVPAPAQAISAEQAAALVEAVYPQAAADWSSNWDEGWLSRRAA